VHGRARLVRDPRRGLTIADLRGSVQVQPANRSLRGLRLVAGQQVRVTRTTIGRPFALVPDLRNEIPSPRQIQAGPATVTAPAAVAALPAEQRVPARRREERAAGPRAGHDLQRAPQRPPVRPAHW
jgi:hypothetical protein